MFNIFFLYIKMSECNYAKNAYLTYSQENRKIILNRPKDYYENDKKIKKTGKR